MVEKSKKTSKEILTEIAELQMDSVSEESSEEEKLYTTEGFFNFDHYLQETYQANYRYFE
jgi:hypothetical protein